MVTILNSINLTFIYRSCSTHPPGWTRNSGVYNAFFDLHPAHHLRSILLGQSTTIRLVRFVVQGVMAGYDQKSNVVLSDSKERVYSMDEGVEEIPLGLYLVKGDQMCVISRCFSMHAFKQVFDS